jgi:pimeloyl-ACP methyl ester carboxylesterase
MGHRPQCGPLPGFVWYGSDDHFAQPAHRVWLLGNLPNARLVVYDGEGHLRIFEHLDKMLDALTEPEKENPAAARRP